MERNYEVVSSRYGEDAGRGLTGRRMNPYERRPERARWTEREVRRYADMCFLLRIIPSPIIFDFL